jgi:hypothetical protein
MNTRIGYRYADRNDCRQYTSVVVTGTMTWEQIHPYLVNRSSFIPGQIGLEDLQTRFALPGSDHPWHQITADDIHPTEVAATIALTGEQLAERFAQTSWQVNWKTIPEAPKAPSTDDSAASRSPITSRKRKFSADA